MIICLNCQKELSKKFYRGHPIKYCSPKCGMAYRSKNWAKLNPEKIKISRDKGNRDIPRRMLHRIKHKCKKNNIPFNLEIEDIKVPTHCPVLNIKLNWNIGRGGRNWPDSPSIDRIDPKGGYVKGNIRVISNRANLLKSNASVEELEKVLADLKKIQGD